MSHNIIVILTEGDHDSAFLYRILKANGFSSFSEKIKDFPKPLDDFLATDILNITIEEVNIQEARTRFLPSYVLSNGKNLILMYSLGGESRSDKRINLIKILDLLNVKDDMAIQAISDTDISVLYFLDSDNIGIEGRMNLVKEEIIKVFGIENVPEILLDTEIYKIVDINIGAYIFREDGGEKGKLEDILIPLMKDGNQDIFDEADRFISCHENTVLFKGKVIFDENGGIKTVNGKKFDKKKSLVGTVGQLQKSGKSNTVCISDSDYLDDNKIMNSSICNKIFGFIEKVIR